MDLIYLGIITLVSVGILVSLKMFEGYWIDNLTNILRSI